MALARPHDAGPPPIFRRGGTTNRYELVEVGGPAIAHALVDVDDLTWAITEVRASAGDAVRLIVEITAEAVRAGARCLSVELGAGVDDIAALRAAVGGRHLGAWLLIDL